MAQESAATPAVSMHDISMVFPGVKALEHVHFELRKGEVHVLLGENGAGKSTLMKILAGAYQMTEGRVELFGQAVAFHSPREAIDAGVAIIYQELNLIPYLSVAENIFLGRQPTASGLIRWKQIYEETERLLSELGVDIAPKAPVRELSIAQQQMVEIAKAISLNSGIIIMDEPTSALTEKEIDELFSAIRRLTAKGVGIVYISHRLEELGQIGDRATVLRDGKYIATVNIADVTLDDLIGMMVGRELQEKFPKQAVPIGEEALRAEHISTKGKLHDCSFAVRRGEILGVAGLMGAGRTELMMAVTGADPRTAGEVYIWGKRASIRSFRDAVSQGIGLLSEDRKGQGLILGMDVQTNISLVSLDKIKRGPLLSYRKEGQAAQRYVDSLDIKTNSLKKQVKFLSGGNQQKVVLAKWLFSDCDIIIFDEPTRGIDVGAKTEIYRLMIDLARRGAAIIMVSSELPEVLGMSDRIIVMCEGRITGELSREEATQEKILYFATAGEGEKHGNEAANGRDIAKD